MATTKTTTRSAKPATKTTAKPAAKATAKPRKTVKVTPKAAPEVDSAAAETAAARAGALGKRGLISAVTERSGLKRGDAKSAVEMALKVLGEAIADGRGLNLPGIGKLKVTRSKKQGNAHIYITKVRQPVETATPGTDPEPSGDADPEAKGETGPKDPLAEAAE